MLFAGLSRAQSPSSEAAKLQQNAKQFLYQRDFNNAVMLLHQAIRLAPGDVSLRRDLAYTYYAAGNLDKAKETIDPVVRSEVADEETYQVASMIENTRGKFGKARRLLNDGIKKFPHSGMLYNSKGNLFSIGKSDKSALQAWQEGIVADPSYPLNYYNAAKAFLSAGNYVWALLYGEIYLNLDQHAERGTEIKKLMITSYQGILSATDPSELPQFRAENRDREPGKGFEEVFVSTLRRNAGVIRDGLTTESLIMLRTRFVLSWTQSTGRNYPFTLFSYHERLLTSGHFDAYNQWLFGAYLDSKGYSLWLKNHTESVKTFEQWKTRNPLQPASFDPKP